MKIIFIIPSITNFHTFLSELTDHLINLGHEVILLSGEKPIVKGLSPYPEEIQCDWIKIDFPRNFQPNKHISAARKIDHIVQNKTPDLIHVHFSAAMFTVSLARKKNWPRVIATIHGLAWPARAGNKRLLLKKAEVTAAKKMDHVLLLNKQDLALMNQNGIDHAKILFKYGIGCNSSLFKPSITPSTEHLELKKKLGIKKEDIVFIFIGRQTSFKGFNKVIRAFMKIYHAKSPYHLLLIGDTDHIHESGLNPTEESLLSQIPAIHQIGWKKNIENFLAIADINVFPSQREGLPVNLMESLSMGVPVITINSRGCNEIIEHDVNGLILDDESVDTLALAMKQLANNFVLRNRLSENALTDKSKYDRRLFIEKQLEFYETLEHESIAN